MAKFFAASLPTTAKRLVELDHAQQFIAACKGQTSFRLKELSIGVERIQQCRYAACIA
jgi:hypothetical protein